MQLVSRLVLALVACVLLSIACSANLDQSAVKDMSALVAALSPKCQQEILTGQAAKHGRPDMSTECRQQLFKAAAALSRASGVEPTEFLAALAGKVHGKGSPSKQAADETTPAASSPAEPYKSYAGLYISVGTAVFMAGLVAYIGWGGKKQRKTSKRS